MRASVLAIAVTAFALAAPARADESVETAAQVHLDRGVEAFHAGDFTRALRELTAAHELVPNKPNPYRWLALVEIQLGDCASALVHIDGFLARVPAGDERIAEMTRWQVLCRKSTTPTATTAPPPPPPERRSRWWLWTALGVAAAATVGVVIVVSRDDGPSMLPPVRCGAGGCAP